MIEAVDVEALIGSIGEEKPAEEPAMVKLDLGCGNVPREGFEGVDIWGGPNVKHKVNLFEFPWPWADDSVDAVVSSHFFEHIPLDLVIPVFDELWRIMKVDAQATIQGPYYASMRAIQDPTHRLMLSEALPLYFNKKWRDANQLTHYPIKADFDYTYGYIMAPDWESKADDVKDWAIRHYINVVNDLVITLQKRAPTPPKE